MTERTSTASKTPIINVAIGDNALIAPVVFVETLETKLSGSENI